MMEPSHLPTELFLMVTDRATYGTNDSRELYNLSLVAPRWHAMLSSRMYSRWVYDGEKHSISSLWMFLRTIICNGQIANTVEELKIEDWTFGLVRGRNRLTLSGDDLELVRTAIRTTGLQHIETRFFEALRKADPRPLMALLLAKLRNLTTLYAYLLETDIFLDEVLRHAIASPQEQVQNHYRPLHCLREANLASAWNYRRSVNAADHYHLVVNQIRPFFQLPNIHKCSILDLEAEEASAMFGNSPKTSSITDLTLVYRWSCNLTVSDTLALITMPKRLTRLSIYFEDHFLDPEWKQISNADLWDCIRRLEDCIEHLDIYRGSETGFLPKHRANNSHFGTMRGLKRLKSLCIQPEVILGGCCQDKLAPYCLKDTLPANLKSLTFYGKEGLSVNKTLGQQLQDIMTRTEFPQLSYIALEEMNGRIRRCYADPASPPHYEVQQACIESGITYETKPASSCTKGGIGCRDYQHTKPFRGRYEFDKVRISLNAYLDRLREYRSSTNDLRKLSSDDLDTYELALDLLNDHSESDGQ